MTFSKPARTRVPSCETFPQLHFSMTQPDLARFRSRVLYNTVMAVRTRGLTSAAKAAGSIKRPVKIAKPRRKSPVLVAGKAAIRIFVSYSHKDAGAKDKLLIHLAPLMNDSVSAFYDGDMDAGDALHPTIARELRHAHIFIALLSPDYLASHYCWNIEYRRARNRRARGTMRVVGAIVRPCGWKRTVAAGFKQLPADGKPAPTGEALTMPIKTSSKALPA